MKTVDKFFDISELVSMCGSPGWKSKTEKNAIEVSATLPQLSDDRLQRWLFLGNIQC